MRNDKENIIIDLTFKFALGIIKFSETLNENKNFVVSKQVLKSGTSIGALVREAQNAESKVDFIHKMKIAAKEADEAMYWLQLCKYSESYPANELLIEDLTSIIKVLSKIIGTSKR